MCACCLPELVHVYWSKYKTVTKDVMVILSFLRDLNLIRFERNFSGLKWRRAQMCVKGVKNGGWHVNIHKELSDMWRMMILRQPGSQEGVQWAPLLHFL